MVYGEKIIVVGEEIETAPVPVLARELDDVGRRNDKSFQKTCLACEPVAAKPVTDVKNKTQG